MNEFITINAAELPIQSVCVFPANVAEIHRIVPLELQTGQNKIRVERLPDSIEKDSIRVEGVGNAVIVDVVYSPSAVKDDDALETDALEENKRLLYALKTQEQAWTEQLSILQRYSWTLNSATTPADALGGFLDAHLEARTKIDEKLADVRQKTEEAKKARVLLRKEAVEEGAQSRKCRARITVVVQALESGPAKLSLRYMVAGAAWQPSYDIRAEVSPSSKQSSSISLQYRASIAQQTGEAWTDVDLTLSTASPYRGSAIPTLSTFRIGPPMPQVYSQPLTTTMQQVIPSYPIVTIPSPQVIQSPPGFIPPVQGIMTGQPQIVVGGQFAVNTIDVEPPLVPPSPKPLAIQASTAVEGVLSTTYVVPGKSSIPSDGDDGESTHKVLIATVDLNADLEWITVPKLQEAVFLRCKAKNTSPYTLLEGSANVYIDGNFVCRTDIQTVNPQEQFSASLGVDSAVRVTYHNQQKKKQNSTGGILGAKNNNASFTQRITVKNNRGTKLYPLYIKDQVPVSEDNDVKVSVREPSALQTLQDSKELAIAPGVRARWGNNEDGLKEDGIVEFICELEAGKSVDLTLGWDIATLAGKGGWAKW